MRALALSLAVALAVAIAPGAAHAWGGQGHRLIAELAYERLSPVARSTVDRLIASGPTIPIEGCSIATFEDAATWPDCVRSKDPFKGTYNEHFDDIPLFGRASKRVYCERDVCASEAIKRNRAILADVHASDGQRLQALSFLVHYIGDLHQPLHAADNNDKGGNDVKVIYLGQATFVAPWNGQVTQNNLHGVWDTPLVSAALGSDGAGKEVIAAEADAGARRWARFAPDAWARESHTLAERVCYGRLPVEMAPNAPPRMAVEINQAYVDAAIPVVRAQLAKAVVRTAATINAVLR